MESKNLPANDLVGFKDVMKYFNKSRTTINRWVSKGTLKIYGIEGAVYFKASEIKDLIKPLN